MQGPSVQEGASLREAEHHRQDLQELRPPAGAPSACPKCEARKRQGGGNIPTAALSSEMASGLSPTPATSLRNELGASPERPPGEAVQGRWGRRHPGRQSSTTGGPAQLPAIPSALGPALLQASLMAPAVS